MRIKWNFSYQPSGKFSESPSFKVKSTWKPPFGHLNLEVFLNQVEEGLFKLTENDFGYSNLT